MKPLQYIISAYGCGIVIGLIGNKEYAEREAILAENIFGSYWTDELFSGVIHMNTRRQFTKFIFLKEYFALWDEHWTKNRVAGRKDPALVREFIKRAAKRARLILESQVKYENFMGLITARNNEFSLGDAGYQGEPAAT